MISSRVFWRAGSRHTEYGDSPNQPTNFSRFLPIYGVHRWFVTLFFVSLTNQQQPTNKKQANQRFYVDSSPENATPSCSRPRTRRAFIPITHTNIYFFSFFCVYVRMRTRTQEKLPLDLDKSLQNAGKELQERDKFAWRRWERVQEFPRLCYALSDVIVYVETVPLARDLTSQLIKFAEKMRQGNKLLSLCVHTIP